MRYLAMSGFLALVLAFAIPLAIHMGRKMGFLAQKTWDEADPEVAELQDRDSG